MNVLGIAGWSGSGKTSLIVRLVPALNRIGQTVSTLKHAHHDFDLDHKGKDSYRHREAGAYEVLVGSSSRWALMHELSDEDEPEMDELIARMSPVDVLLVEGFKDHPHPKLEVHRPSVGKPILQPNDPHVVAVASDTDLPGVSVPVLDLADADAIAHFVVEYFRRRAA